MVVRPRGRRFLLALIGVSITGGLIWALYRETSFTELLVALRTPNYWWLVPNVAIGVLGLYQRAHRWGLLLAPLGPVSRRDLMAATCIGYMANNLLPFRLGELVRAMSLSARERQVPTGSALAAIFVEKGVLDLVSLLLLAAFMPLLIGHGASRGMQHAIYITVGLSVAALAGIGVAVFAGQHVDNWINRLFRRVLPHGQTRMITICRQAREVLGFSRDPRQVAMILLATAAIWVNMAVATYCLFLAFGFNLPFQAAFVMAVIVSLLLVVPSSPGYVGVYHAGVVVTLGLYSTPEVPARAFALVIHATQFVPVTLLGLYYLRLMRLSLRRLMSDTAASAA